MGPYRIWLRYNQPDSNCIEQHCDLFVPHKKMSQEYVLQHIPLQLGNIRPQLRCSGDTVAHKMWTSRERRSCPSSESVLRVRLCHGVFWLQYSLSHCLGNRREALRNMLCFETSCSVLQIHRHQIKSLRVDTIHLFHAYPSLVGIFLSWCGEGSCADQSLH